jgi:hypothetical protein
MSALGQKQTSGQVCGMSALLPKADMDQHSRDVRFLPIADIRRLILAGDAGEAASPRRQGIFCGPL